MNLSYRPAKDSDFEFCRAIHHAGMRPYVEPLWGWEGAPQDERYRGKWKPERIEIILADGRAVGYLETYAVGAELRLENLMIAESERGRGIGTAVLSRWLGGLTPDVERVRLNVLKNNPSHRLYERLGFRLAGPIAAELLELELVCSFTHDDFLEAFERCTLPRVLWKHRAHIRMAWCYLQAHPFPRALELARQGIQRYNGIHGKPGGYRETETVFFMRLIGQRAKQAQGLSFETFCEKNADLFDGKNPPRKRHYSDELWRSPRTWPEFVEPDLAPIPEP